MPRSALVLAILGAFLLASCEGQRGSHASVKSSVEYELRQIHAIDNHAHPMKAVGQGEEDHEYDALPVEGIPSFALPTVFSEGNPYFPQAWHTLFGYRYSDSKPEHLAELEKAKRDLAKQKGDLYPSWVLNQANTEIMLANRVAMGRGLPSDRFKWVPFADMFLFPLNNESYKAKDPDHDVFFGREEKLLKGYMANAQMQKLPVSFDDYLTFVSHQLESWKSGGAVAFKFELAYLRDLDIGNPQKENAERVYSIYSQSSAPSDDEYKMVQDYVFRHIAHEAGRLGLPVHFHCALGAGSYFRDATGNSLALEPLFNDPGMRKTNFVLLHGGWPFTKESALMILKPNVYLDFSAFEYFAYPSQAARDIRLFLESAPEKVLYGSDASPWGGDVGWEETAWIGSNNGRQALGLALTAMIDDGEISEDRAKEIAHMVMRENARRLYRF
ncbi:MAG: amidohydrolase family protein [Acidobacteriaceae bacterium]|nr:amidohydrolase family protein [Acidobacteriaceae bacterium]MBV9780582.1 amidohydrolase family protein [Acidobacteriaceae bacterium]